MTCHATRSKSLIVERDVEVSFISRFSTRRLMIAYRVRLSMGRVLRLLPYGFLRLQDSISLPRCPARLQKPPHRRRRLQTPPLPQTRRLHPTPKPMLPMLLMPPASPLQPRQLWSSTPYPTWLLAVCLFLIPRTSY